VATCAGAKAKASMILSKVQSGSMPPSGPLPAADVALIKAWVDGGSLCSAPGCP
jgi:hypothetical protein